MPSPTVTRRGVDQPLMRAVETVDDAKDDYVGASSRCTAIWLRTAAATARAGLRSAGPSRRARPHAGESRWQGFAAALALGVTTLELDLGMTKDGVLVVSHDSRSQSRSHPRAGWTVSRRPRAGYSLAHARRAEALRRRPPQARHRLRQDAFRNNARSTARPSRRWPRCSIWFAKPKADHVRFNIETKLTPTSGADGRRSGNLCRRRGASAVRAAGVAARVTVQSFDWRTLAVVRRIAPEIERACITIERRHFKHAAARRAGPLALDRRPRHRRFRRLGPAPGPGRRLRDLVAAVSRPDARSARGSQGDRIEGHPLDRQRAQPTWSG